VLSGNSHNYERSYPLHDGAPASGGVTYVVSGGGGNGFNRFTQAQPAWSAFREDNAYQYVRISVSPAQLTVNAVAASSGAVIDSVVIPVGNGGTGPTEPANLVAHASDPNTIRLSWKASSDSVSTITGYRVYRDGAQIAQTSALTFADASLAVDGSYAYVVRAIDGAGNLGPPSPTRTIQVDQTPPPAPTHIVAASPANVVTFSFRTKGPGKCVWNCEFPCGDGTYAKFGEPMSTRGCAWRMYPCARA